jgi:Flp pilus assembly protein TadG
MVTMLRPHTLAKKQRRGALTVEAAILISFILVPLLAGVWEVGRVIEARQILDNACREGGRQASTGTRTTAQVTQTVLNYLDRNLPPTYVGGTPVQPSAGVTVTLTNLTDPGQDDPTQADQLDRFQITVVFPTANARWIDMPGWIVQPATLTATSQWFSMKDIPLTVSSNIPAE